jgi:hypothetical protein
MANLLCLHSCPSGKHSFPVPFCVSLPQSVGFISSLPVDTGLCVPSSSNLSPLPKMLNGLKELLLLLPPPSPRLKILDSPLRTELPNMSQMCRLRPFNTGGCTHDMTKDQYVNNATIFRKKIMQKMLRLIALQKS